MIEIQRGSQGGRIVSMMCWMSLYFCFVGPLWGQEDDLSAHYGFQEMEILKLDWELGRPLCGDINRDGYRDIVVCNNRKSRIELLLQKPGFEPRQAVLVSESKENVNDTIGKSATWRFELYHYPLDVRAVSLVLADFNADGWLDMAYYCSKGIRIVYQEAPTLEGEEDVIEPTWLPEKRFDLTSGLKSMHALAAGDLNNDHRCDLGLLLPDGYYLLFQTEAGGMAKPVRHFSAADQLKQMAVADMDGDGLSDLVLLSQDAHDLPLRIRFQGSNHQLGPERRYHIPASAHWGFCTFGDTAQAKLVTVAQQTGRLGLFTLASAAEVESDITVYPLPLTDDAESRAMVSADLDGNGQAELVVTHPGRAQFMVLSGGTDGRFAAPQTYPGLKGMRKLGVVSGLVGMSDALVVLSQDEKLIGLSSYEDGRLTFPRTISVVGEPRAMDIADVDGNGHDDLIYVALQEDDRYSLETLLDVGRGTTRPGPRLDLKDLEDAHDLLTGDIDHDGRLDIMILQSYDPLTLVRQTAPGVLEQVTPTNIHIGLVSDIEPKSLSVAHFGPKQLPMLLAAQNHFVRALYFDSDKGWQVYDQYQSDDRHESMVLAYHFHRSEQDPPELVTYDEGVGSLSFLQREGGSYHNGREIKGLSVNPRALFSDTFFASSQRSLLLCGTRQIVHVEAKGTNKAFRQMVGFEPTIDKGRLGSFTIGDVNGDAVPEIVVCEQKSHHVQILAFNEKAQLSGDYSFKVFEQHAGETVSHKRANARDSGEPRHAVVSDLTGDGHNDLLLLVHDRLILYPQDPGL